MLFHNFRLSNHILKNYLAISAGCPIFRGYLADVDCRWNVISGSVDDRTKQERSEEVQLYNVFKTDISNKKTLENSSSHLLAFKYLNPDMPPSQRICLQGQTILVAVAWEFTPTMPLMELSPQHQQQRLL